LLRPIFSVQDRCTLSPLVHLMTPFLPAAPAYLPVPPVTVKVPSHDSLSKLVEDRSPDPSLGARLNLPRSELVPKYWA